MNKAAKKHDAETQAKTRFVCHATNAQGVYLSGTFNDWAPSGTLMERKDEGTWSVELELVPGRYEYKFVVDGVWCCEPDGVDNEAKEGLVPNPFGTMNHVIEVHRRPGTPQSHAAAH